MKVLNKEFAYYVRIIFHYMYILRIYKYFKALFYLQSNFTNANLVTLLKIAEIATP